METREAATPDAGRDPAASASDVEAPEAAAAAGLVRGGDAPERADAKGAPTSEQVVDGRVDETGWTGAIAGSGMFPELVRAHYEWEQDPGRTGPVAERYRDALEAFQNREGQLVQAYWATQRPSAVALTLKPRGRISALVHDNDATIRLHRVTDWLAREHRIAELLHHCDTLAIKVSEVLRGTTERIAMQWIYAVQSHLLGYLERTEGADQKELAAVVKSQGRELIQIERYYASAGEKAARIVYFWGMMIGALVSAVLAIGLAGLLWWRGWFDPPHTLDTQTFFACFIAGGVGAIVSVLMRMSSNRFRVDYEVGRSTIRRLGSFRPFIGAVFGIALYFLFHSELLRTALPDDRATAFFFFGTLAFLAGFNERWANVLFGKAEKTIAASLGNSTRDGEDEEERQ